METGGHCAKLRNMLLCNKILPGDM